jgi:FKBP-type peptidyl-prolyl cis-trans isomerase FklB
MAGQRCYISFPETDRSFPETNQGKLVQTKYGLFLIMATAAAAGCQSGPGSAALETDDQKASYGIGRDIGAQLAPASAFIDMDALRRGLEDEFADREFAVPPSELQGIMQSFGQRVAQAHQQSTDSLANANRAEGEAFLARNAEKAGVTTTESGLQYEVMREGEGPRPSGGQEVRIHYEGKLVDGTVFDSSYERDTPATFTVGQLINGFNEGLMLMNVGSQYRLVIPGDLGYGAQGQGEIGPHATLIFEVELLAIP